MEKFEADKTYWTRSVCDHDCIIRVEIVSRTDKTIKTCRIVSADRVSA